MYIQDLTNFLKKTGSGRGRNNTANAIFNHYLTDLCNMAQSSINWVGDVPIEIPEMKLEEYLLFNTHAVFFKDDVLDRFLVLPAVDTGMLDPNGLPKQVQAYGIGVKYDIDLTKGEGVLIYDNYNRTSILPDLCMYAKRMTDTLITTDVNLAQQRIPLLFRTSKQGKVNIDRAMQAQEAGAYSCVVDNALPTDIAELMYQPVPYIADKLQIELEKIWAEALTFIGIVNVDEKAERLNAFEVGSQIEEVVAHLNTRLKPRKDACRKIKELYGLDIDVIPANWTLTKDRKDTIEGTDEPMAEQEGGFENEFTEN